MEKINVYIANLVFIFIVIYLIDYYIVLKPKLSDKKKKKIKKTKKKREGLMEVDYLSFKFGIPKLYLMDYKIFKQIALFNAFIISLTSTVIMFIPIHISFQLLLGFALLFGLIYSIYEIYGRYLVKKINNR